MELKIVLDLLANGVVVLAGKQIADCASGVAWVQGLSMGKTSQWSPSQ